MSALYILVDLGGTHVRVATATAEQLLVRLQERTHLLDGPAGVEGQIVGMAREALRQTGRESTDARRLVISTPGPLDPNHGVVVEAPNMPGWDYVPIKADLEQALGVPVTALNDANAAALGEHRFGAGRGKHHLVYLTISTGIGGGVVVNDVLLEGASGTAGEIGHMTIDRHGPVCTCGNIGCLEILASGTSIARRFGELLAAGERSVVTEWTDVPTARDISRAAAEGDPLAASLFHDAARAVGTGVVNCVHIFNPEIVVLGGGVTNAGDLLFDPIRDMVARHAMKIPRDTVAVVRAELGDDAGLYGTLAKALAEEQPLAHAAQPRRD
jgi:glucokinase